jgi:hypothetical protein
LLLSCTVYLMSCERECSTLVKRNDMALEMIILIWLFINNFVGKGLLERIKRDESTFWCIKKKLLVLYIGLEWKNWSDRKEILIPIFFLEIFSETCLILILNWNSHSWMYLTNTYIKVIVLFQRKHFKFIHNICWSILFLLASKLNIQILFTCNFIPVKVVKYNVG